MAAERRSRTAVRAARRRRVACRPVYAADPAGKVFGEYPAKEHPVPGRHLTDHHVRHYMSLCVPTTSRRWPPPKAAISTASAHRIESDPRLPSQKPAVRGRRRHLEHLLAAGRLPDPAALRARFLPDPAALPQVNVRIGSLADYDQLLAASRPILPGRRRMKAAHRPRRPQPCSPSCACRPSPQCGRS